MLVDHLGDVAFQQDGILIERHDPTISKMIWDITMAIIGYARVSSTGQSLEIQLDRLSHCDKVFQEKTSGASAARPRFNACIEYVREGDFLVVTRLDRLARSTFHLCQIAEQLQNKGVELQVLDQNIDTSDATGRLLFNMLGAIAQFETEIRAERQLEGIGKAKAQGVAFSAGGSEAYPSRMCGN